MRTSAFRTHALTLWLLLAFAAALPASAATLLVPEDYALQAAVEAAEPGDVVSVAAGRYQARTSRFVPDDGQFQFWSAVLFLKAGVTVESRGGVVEIDGTSADRRGAPFVVVADRLAGDPAVLRGLVLVADASTRSTLTIQQSGTVVLDRCKIRDAGVERFVEVEDAGPVEFRGCSFSAAGSDASIPHLVELTNSGVAFVDCTFEGTALGGVRAVGGQLALERTRFAGTRAGVELQGTSAKITACDFDGVENAAVYALDFGRTDDFLVQDCWFRGAAIGVQAIGAPFDVRHSVFLGAGAGAAVISSARGTIQGNTFVGWARACDNRNGEGLTFARNVVAGGVGESPAVQGGPAAGDCNLYWDNAGGDSQDWTHGASDLFVDPLFCDPATGDYTVRADSPAARAACGPIGALEVGCSVLAITPSTWAEIKAMHR